jgi:hypothetical protein
LEKKVLSNLQKKEDMKTHTYNEEFFRLLKELLQRYRDVD